MIIMTMMMMMRQAALNSLKPNETLGNLAKWNDDNDYDSDYDYELD